MVLRPHTAHNDQLWQKHCRKVIALAQRIIDGEVGIIEGSRKMLTYQVWLHAQNDEDFEIFRTLDSETLHLPLGKIRVHWSAHALKEKDAQIKSFEDFYRARVIEAAAKIRAKYE